MHSPNCTSAGKLRFTAARDFALWRGGRRERVEIESRGCWKWATWIASVIKKVLPLLLRLRDVLGFWRSNVFASKQAPRSSNFRPGQSGKEINRSRRFASESLPPSFPASGEAFRSRIVHSFRFRWKYEIGRVSGEDFLSLGEFFFRSDMVGISKVWGF